LDLVVDFDRVFLDFNGTKCGFLKIPKPDLLYLLFSINISLGENKQYIHVATYCGWKKSCITLDG